MKEKKKEKIFSFVFVFNYKFQMWSFCLVASLLFLFSTLFVIFMLILISQLHIKSLNFTYTHVCSSDMQTNLFVSFHNDQKNNNRRKNVSLYSYRTCLSLPFKNAFSIEFRSVFSLLRLSSVLRLAFLFFFFFFFALPVLILTFTLLHIFLRFRIFLRTFSLLDFKFRYL